PENLEIQTFYDSGEDVCYEDGKPVIRMYASSGCGYCTWNKPMYEEVAREYPDAGKIVAYLWEDGKNMLSEEQEAMPIGEDLLRQKYGFSGVPAFIFGCKYYRSGAAYSRAENGEVLEEAELRTVIEDILAAQ
ncbi:MAG: thioredoxin family protein, partial [Candidatus Aenigmarchaeota archaeon]|nr:thioredoxin family protein [Candidatus Aenigmarchaeota archaeon]